MGLVALKDNGLATKINLFSLLAAIAVILFLPLRKEIWYDETVSVLCAKGISHDSPLLFADSTTVSSETLNRLNTSANVFDATVNDNANSYLYNIGLHWFTVIAGNSIMAYMLFSKLIAIATLLSFFLLCRQFFGNSFFTTLAFVFFACDAEFVGMSHEIRAYAMGILFITLAGIYFFRFLDQNKPIHLFLTGIFSVAAVLSHFLSVYIVLVFLGAMLLYKKAALLNLKNVLAVVLPVGLIALYFYFAYPGLQTMDRQNHQIQQKALAGGFSLLEVFVRALKFTAINLKVIFPAFINNKLVTLFSFFFAAILFISGLRLAKQKEQSRMLCLLLALAAGSSLFLGALCIKSHHYTALYYRYFSFCLPFCSLYIAYLFYLLYSGGKIKYQYTIVLVSLLAIPSLVFFAITASTKPNHVKYNHPGIAVKIQSDKVSRITVPEWRDALLINSLLPEQYKISYFCDPKADSFTLLSAKGEEKMPVYRLAE